VFEGSKTAKKKKIGSETSTAEIVLSSSAHRDTQQ